jgi:hypothetical protein
MRRLATQLRRMKDRSGLTVPALAARTAQPAETWERVLAGRQLPPLDAVEVLAQASGADYDRVGELWRLAEKASAGTGDRGRGKAVPDPDPLDPLGSQEGLPGRGRRFLLLGAVGLLAVGALIAVLLTAGPSTGRSPAGGADPSATAPAASGASAPAHRKKGDTSPPSRPGGLGSAAPGARDPGGMDQPLTGAGEPSESGTDAGGTSGTSGTGTTAGTSGPGAPGGNGGHATAPPAGGAGGGGSGGGSGGTTTGAPAPPPSSPSPSTGPTPSPSSTSLCLGLILLGVCIG